MDSKDFSTLFDFVKLCLHLFDFVWLTQLCTNFVLVCWMSIDVFHWLTISKWTYIHKILCTRDYFSAKISLKEYFWQDLIGVWKITILSKDPVCLVNTPYLYHRYWHIELFCHNYSMVIVTASHRISTVRLYWNWLPITEDCYSKGLV